MSRQESVISWRWAMNRLYDTIVMTASTTTTPSAIQSAITGLPSAALAMSLALPTHLVGQLFRTTAAILPHVVGHAAQDGDLSVELPGQVLRLAVPVVEAEQVAVAERPAETRRNEKLLHQTRMQHGR